MPRRNDFSDELERAHTGFRQDSAPPSYEEAINPNAPPPTYDSLFGRVREAQKSSRGIVDFFKNLVIIILGTLGCTIIIGITIVVPICMITIGVIYMHDCPQGEYIPVYLVVGGLFGILKQLLHLSARVRQTEEERREENLRQSPTQTLLNCFMLGWFIIGSVWVYKEYEPNYDQRLGLYCNKTLYLFAFWLITAVYIILGIITVCLCSISIATVIFHSDATHGTRTSSI
ncbi:transmembrane protein 272-like [Harmonia axyridis]|uniref:transmembrane protein 272-like n=1 Tax=Harmonia axyridis TaxID=115357 RepID=UPI001E279C1F|nr:transmembrane protein 272-like [Harmonia axyridis]